MLFKTYLTSDKGYGQLGDLRITTLKELLEFAKYTGRQIIITQPRLCTDNKWSIEVYDAKRER